MLAHSEGVVLCKNKCNAIKAHKGRKIYVYSLPVGT
jgi:hypothetical protein